MILWLKELKSKIDKRKNRELIYLLPMILFCLFWFYKSLDYHLHDYGSGYFPALMVVEDVKPESLLFDIYDYNQYIWEKGYSEEISDFYLNSPFFSTLFYPFALISDVYLSKAIFNAVSILLFLYSLWGLAKRYLKEWSVLLLILPLVFFFPIRNHILFGQSYMLIFAFTSIAIMAFEKGKNLLGGSLLSIAVLTKVFPVFYILALAFQRKWKAIAITAVTGLVIFSVSWFVSGPSFWQEYLLEVLPNALASQSTTDFRPNAQSIDVFFRTLLIRDAYYNPGAFAHNPQLYQVITGLLKAVILGLTLQASYIYRKNLFQLLAIWVAALFLMQTRTGTYAQILWIIPVIALFRSSTSTSVKVIFLGTLLLICNFPYAMLINAPVVITFARLWLSILLLVLFWKSLDLTFNLRYLGLGLILVLPLTIKSMLSDSSGEDAAQYVIDKKMHFMIYDFQEENGHLRYHAIGNKGDVSIDTAIPVSTFDSSLCTIREGQVYYGEQRLTEGSALKKKPVLVNGCEVYYLSDQLSRRGAYTLKKIDVCKEAKGG